jgi:hypothetical protein
VFLAVRGADDHRCLIGHVVAAAIGAAPALRHAPVARLPQGFLFSLALLIVLPLSTVLYRKAFRFGAQIRNALVVPTSMDGEGGGTKSPFFVSARATSAALFCELSWIPNAAANAIRHLPAVEKFSTPFRIVQ